VNVLLIGSGGREHALCWAINKSPLLTKLYCALGNGGIADLAECLTIDASDHQAVINFCTEAEIGLVVIGPEDPLAAGLGDDLRAAGVPVFGPSAAAARLESSKGFMKDLCTDNNIPTAGYARFQDLAAAEAYIRANGAPIVVKADGLAAGKGVTVAMTEGEALAAVSDCLGGRFGQAGAEVVIEEFLEGEEASFFVISDGKTIAPFGTAQDHKRAFDNDEGPNTGGMGAYSPAPVMTDAMIARTMGEIITPTIDAMAAAGTPFRGVLYAGLMITDTGPKLIEYNVRFGDPECQVLMMRLETDMLEILTAASAGKLTSDLIAWRDDAALTIVMATQGYPGEYEAGSRIAGIGGDSDTGMIFHAGTRRDGDQLVASGGRVLNVTARGSSVRDARDKAYARLAAIDWPEGFYRSDIGWRAIAREEAKKA
jgi:phosphoribosylamine---glycine ligase